MSGHTPGPWRLEVGVNTGWFDIRGPKGIGDVLLAQRPAWPDRAAESVANARLIAAAPELLAVVDRMLLTHGCDLPPAECADCRDARLAIAKAEGRS